MFRIKGVEDGEFVTSVDNQAPIERVTKRIDIFRNLDKFVRFRVLRFKIICRHGELKDKWAESFRVCYTEGDDRK